MAKTLRKLNRAQVEATKVGAANPRHKTFA